VCTARPVVGAAASTSSEQQTENRIATEERLLRNEVKAVVATSALGMGYDKADLTFVVHYQAPGSVVAYYQQVGRAGRAVDHADVVLLRGGEDRRIQDFFIEQAFPTRERVAAVLGQLEAAGEQGRTTRELMAVVNLGMGRIEAMLKILDVEGAVRRDGTRWRSVPGAGWTYDADRYEQVTALRRREQDTMAAFGADRRCLMRVLQEELDDPDPRDCGRCSVCTSPRFAEPPHPALVELAARHLRSTPLELEVKKMAPDAAGAIARSQRMHGLSAAGRSRALATAAGGPPSSAACATGPSRTKLSPAPQASCELRASPSPGSPACHPHPWAK
jgi:ATP-dependent DNA helicase RecQ